MKVTALSLATIGAVSAFAPATKTSSSIALKDAKSDLVDLSSKLNPVVNYFDPLQLADAEFWDDSNEATIGFLRQAEIKHGRVAMAAFVGYCVQSNVHWPWKMTLAGADFPSTDLSPEAQWDAIPDEAKWQIILIIGFFEAWGEQGSKSNESNAHYMRGGKPGVFPTFDLFRQTVHPVPFDLYDPFGFSRKASPEKKEAGLIKEINNGRLAMIGIMGFLAADKVEGSVPALKGIAIPYDGDSMAPFAADFSIFS